MSPHIFSSYVACMNVDARIKAHNAGRGARFTRGRGPGTLRYKERQADKSHALKRELEIKAWRREKKESLFHPRRKQGKQTAGR
ncbi:MAG: GIY-YIG nuclease family protein [bacterium]